MTLSKAILMYRAKHNVSMREFAQQCGITLQTVYNIETCGQKPSRVTKAKIELVIGGEYDIDEECEEEEAE